jgi:glycine/D-amino acid oxidase-like deaminating enzyme
MDATQSAIYGASLYAATAVERAPSPQLTQDMDIDVCVVGGGLAGLTVAYEIARRGWPVVLLEAKRIAWNASGRNTGFVLPGFAQDPAQTIERVGADAARALWALSVDGVDYVRNVIAETGMEGVDPVDGWLCPSKVDRADGIARDAELLRDTLGAQIEVLDTDKVRSGLVTNHYFQGLYYPKAFSIHPLNYAIGLARAAEKAGVRIFEDTPVLDIDPDGVRKRIATPSARLRASHVVLAGNVHLGALMPDISGTLLPITTYLIATEPLGERLDAAMKYRGAVSDSEWADNHYRPTPDNRLIWSGRITTSARNPKRYIRALRRDIARIYPQLGEFDADYFWNGTLGASLHRMPQIGEVSPGLWVASGFGGHGLNTTALAGLLIARGIVEGDKTWTAFNPFELIWAGGRIGRAYAKARYWTYRLKETIEAAMSRYRDTEAVKAREDAAAAAETAAALKVPQSGPARGK